MSVAQLLARLSDQGIRVSLESSKLRVRGPVRAITTGLTDELRRRKPEIVETLRATTPGNAKLAEIERHVEQDGYVLLWASELDDLVAFCQTEAGKSCVPPGFVVYSRAELTTLFGDASTAPSVSELRMIHHVKKLGGGKVRDDPEP